MWKNTSSIWCWDWNPQPSEHLSPPITIRRGLLPCFKIWLWEFTLGSQRKRMLKKNSRWKKSNLIISGVKLHVFKEKSTSTCISRQSYQPQIYKSHRFGLLTFENCKRSSQRESSRCAKSGLYEANSSSTKKITKRETENSDTIVNFNVVNVVAVVTTIPTIPTIPPPICLITPLAHRLLQPQPPYGGPIPQPCRAAPISHAAID